MFGRLMGNAGNVDAEKLQKEFGKLLADDEAIHSGYKVIRDTIIFTDRRVIMIDVQGITGRKKEYLSIPYSKISMFSVESAGSFDLDAELKIWISGVSGPIEKQFNKSANVWELQSLLAEVTSG